MEKVRGGFGDWRDVKGEGRREIRGVGVRDGVARVHSGATRGSSRLKEFANMLSVKLRGSYLAECKIYGFPLVQVAVTCKISRKCPRCCKHSGERAKPLWEATNGRAPH